MTTSQAPHRFPKVVRYLLLRFTKVDTCETTCRLEMHIPISLLLLFVVSVKNVIASTSSHAQAILIDTDIMSDVDDVGAIAVANVLHNCGLADLRGITINTHSKYGALASEVRTSDVYNR